jgi:hypothetical protein
MKPKTYTVMMDFQNPTQCTTQLDSVCFILALLRRWKEHYIELNTNKHTEQTFYFWRIKRNPVKKELGTRNLSTNFHSLTCWRRIISTFRFISLSRLSLSRLSLSRFTLTWFLNFCGLHNNSNNMKTILNGHEKKQFILHLVSNVL